MPITSCHGVFGYSRSRFPTAAEGVPQNSRARFSEIITIGLRSYTSVHVNSRPAISREPVVRRNPGEILSNRRKGATLPGYTLPSANTLSQLGGTPSIGASLAKPTDVTPGMALNLSARLFSVLVTSWGSGMSVDGIEMRTV